MENFSTFIDFYEVEITYDQYIKILENLNTDDYLTEANFSIQSLGKLKVIFSEIKNVVQEISSNLKLSFNEIIDAFKNKSFYDIVKAFKFSFKTILKSINEITNLIRQGLFKVFEEIHKSFLFQEIKKGTVKIDLLLEKYPILKKVGGIAVAGILFYIWLNMSFIGDLDYDFNFSDIAAALSGKYSITDLFLSPSGLMMLTLFGTGMFTGLSAPWLGKTIYNLILGITYTLFVKSKNSVAASNIKKYLKIT